MSKKSLTTPEAISFMASHKDFLCQNCLLAPNTWQSQYWAVCDNCKKPGVEYGYVKCPEVIRSLCLALKQWHEDFSRR